MTDQHCESGACGRVALIDGQVHIWSSRYPDRIATLDVGEWTDLLAAVKRGELDHIGEDVEVTP